MVFLSAEFSEHGGRIQRGRFRVRLRRRRLVDRGHGLQFSSTPNARAGNLERRSGSKVRDTLAGLAAAATNAENADEKEIARRALDPNRRWRVALHLELPDQHSELWSKKNDLADLRLKLRAALKSVDPNAGVVDTSRAHVDMNWKSQRK